MLIKLLSNKNLFIIIILATGSFSSCRKDKLKGEKDIFIGKWEWIYSDHSYGWCNGDDYFETLTPQTENTSFLIEFFKKGKLVFYQNDILINEYRIKFLQFEDVDYCPIYDSYKFGIDLNNQEELNFNGCINTDTIYLGSFPDFMFQAESGCENYDNYFIKE